MCVSVCMLVHAGLCSHEVHINVPLQRAMFTRMGMHNCSMYSHAGSPIGTPVHLCVGNTDLQGSMLMYILCEQGLKNN